MHRDNRLIGALGVVCDVFLASYLYVAKTRDAADLNPFDRTFVMSLVLVRAIFYWALWHHHWRVLRVVHVLVFIYPTMALRVRWMPLKWAALILLVLIQGLWATKGRCILNDEDPKSDREEEGKRAAGWFGFSPYLRIYTLLLTVALSRATV